MGKTERKEVLKIGSWEDRRNGEKGSFEIRKLGRWENLCNLCSITVIEDFWRIQKSQINQCSA